MVSFILMETFYCWLKCFYSIILRMVTEILDITVNWKRLEKMKVNIDNVEDKRMIAIHSYIDAGRSTLLLMRCRKLTLVKTVFNDSWHWYDIQKTRLIKGEIYRQGSFTSKDRNCKVHWCFTKLIKINASLYLRTMINVLQ